MKSVLISINPKWCEKIASGKKTVEVRKTRPKLEMPFKCYIYCTKGKSPSDILCFAEYDNGKYVGDYTANGKVIGEFVCDEIVAFCNIGTDKWKYLVGRVHEDMKRIVTHKALLTEEQMLKYRGKYGWHISELVIYDKPKELSEFFIDCKGGCDIPYLYTPPCERCKKNKLTRPPQSWCYVEEG